MNPQNPYVRPLSSILDEHYTELESLFHPYFKDKLKGRLKIKPGDSPDKILKEALKLKNELKVQEKKELVLSFVSELEKGKSSLSAAFCL